MNPHSAKVVQRIRALRQQQRLSAADLADGITAAGYPVSRGQVANFETGRAQNVSLEYVVLAARVLGAPPGLIVEGPAGCRGCAGSPPEGFTCNTCGTSSEREQ